MVQHKAESFCIADLSATTRLSGKVWPQHVAVYEKEIAAYYQLPDVFWPDAFIVRIDNKVVGFALIITSSLSHDACELCWVMTDPDYRQQGIGEALVNAAISKASERQQTMFFSTFRPTLYQKLGLQPVGEWRPGRHYFIVHPKTLSKS